nr:MAG TPA: hypothetical protein [Caudoviricetes sp.]DAY47189.1 MAG TPA: hypothetical protein [Caudoviricetes sp.]
MRSLGFSFLLSEMDNFYRLAYWHYSICRF